MKAMPYLFAISLAANFVLGWMLWQQHPAPVSPEPAIVQSESADSDELPLPTTPMPLTASPFLPLEEDAKAPAPLRPTASDMRASFTPVDEADKPYAPPPPPNPHAYPPWQQRTPHREPQYHRALLTPEPR